MSGRPDPRKSGKMAIWEYGRRLLGYGDYDPNGGEYYAKWAGMESHKLYLSMKKRNVSAEEFFLAVEYCNRHHIHIENPVWVFKHIADAKHEAHQLAQQQEDVSVEIQRAVACERALADKRSEGWLVADGWIERLVRARGAARKEVLEEWRNERAPLMIGL